MSESTRFEQLKTELAACCYPAKTKLVVKDSQSAAPVVFPDRGTQLVAHADFLAVSWQGDLDYWRGVEAAREEKRLGKLIGNEAVPRRDRRRLSLEAVRKRYFYKQNGPYAIERMVFFKSSERVPKSLEALALECLSHFHDAPLHNFIILERCQPVADEYAELFFTRWRGQGKNHRELADVVAALAAEINVEPIGKHARAGESGRWPSWSMVFAAALVGLAGGAALVLSWLPMGMVARLLEFFR